MAKALLAIEARRTDASQRRGIAMVLVALTGVFLARAGVSGHRGHIDVAAAMSFVLSMILLQWLVAFSRSAARRSARPARIGGRPSLRVIPGGKSARTRRASF
jgi:hypothetical protein